MAQCHSQPHAQQLKHEDGVLQVRFQLADLAALALNQDAQAVQFRDCKSGCVGVVEDVGAMAVGIAMGYQATNFVKPGRPVELARCSLTSKRRSLVKQRTGRARNPFRVLHVHAKPLHQAVHGGGAQVGSGLFAVQ